MGKFEIKTKLESSGSVVILIDWLFYWNYSPLSSSSTGPHMPLTNKGGQLTNKFGNPTRPDPPTMTKMDFTNLFLVRVKNILKNIRKEYHNMIELEYYNNNNNKQT